MPSDGVAESLPLHITRPSRRNPLRHAAVLISEGRKGTQTRGGGRLWFELKDMIEFAHGKDTGANDSTTPPPAPPILTGANLFKSLLGQFVCMKDEKILKWGKLCNGTLTGLSERDTGRAELLLEDLSDPTNAENHSRKDTIRKKLRSLGGESLSIEY